MPETSKRLIIMSYPFGQFIKDKCPENEITAKCNPREGRCAEGIKKAKQVENQKEEIEKMINMYGHDHQSFIEDVVTEDFLILCANYSYPVR